MGELASRDQSVKKRRKPKDKAQRRKYLGMYLRWLSPYRNTVVALGSLALVIAVLDMAQPLFMRHIIDEVLLNESMTTGQRLSHLHVVGAVFLGVIVLSRFLEATRNFQQRLLNVKVLLSLRRALFNRMLGLPLAELNDMKTGGIISRLSGDIDRTTGLLQLAIISPSVSLVRLLVALGILLSINWKLALAAMVVLPPALLLSLTIAQRVRPIYRSMREENAAIDARVSETFGGIRVVRSFQREVNEEATYLGGRNTIARKQLFAHWREILLWSSWGFLLASVNVVIIWMGGAMQIFGKATVGDIMAFQWYTLMLLEPVWAIVNSFSELQRSLAGMERVFEVIESPIDKPDRPDAVAAPTEVQELRFDHVGFEYTAGEPVISDFDLTVPGGSVVALVGRSGAGKTTVTDLVARFYDPTSGAITLNGRDLRDLKLASYRNLLGVVQQEVFLFDGTIRSNIAYGRPKATEEEVVEAARRANAHQFISEMPAGYDTVIGERGVRLSGGQAQRLSIARALLADPKILILDEATSNLDTESEQLIQQSLDDLMHGRTTFVIAHRLSTVASADVILVMEQGRIIERGTHDDLLAARGAYFDMVTRQRDAMHSDLLSTL
ncbi:putative multidrug export ATP-binding/permease protein [Posidoniimonas corsicana]|uniref:Putative multidrug export ATP-binding/permease protein n=1 Tax=Posidoniimonas corsicana TaxID=1938618 RepID=A0A5C5VG43_9BACT|nr:ABC transporter ATP-binding protein [Posidoniimonas corsicana]TWT36665.1 putative multidrug export ATP-binding/permease protein [Posidoniimonas corsicana]